MFFGERKTGCRFYEFVFHGYRSLLIENDCIRTVLLLDKGTDIISFVDKKTDTEFVWTNPMGLSCLEKIRFAHMDGDCFSDNYVGGWFEILPNFGQPCDYAGKHFIGHSEVAYLPWDYTVLQDREELIELLFVTRLSKYPFELRKRLTVKKGQACLFWKEEVRNLGEKPLEYMWAHHPNVGKPFLSEECDIELPFLDAPIPMPAPGTFANGIYDYSNISEGWGAIRNRNTGIGIGFAWDTSVFKHCKLWINSDYDHGHHHHEGAYVACILPSSSEIMCLDKSAAQGDTLRLMGGAKQESSYTITVLHQLQKVSGISLDGGAR